jgi:MFS family permease
MPRLFIKHPHILFFGILQLFFTAPGQTFLISLFVAPMFADIGVSASLFATTYCVATLAGALLLNPIGVLLDRHAPKTILPMMSLLMASGCFLLAFTHSIVMMFFAFFLLRLIGQGGFSLTASTVISRGFHKNRAKAMGLITLGYPLSELVFPGIAVTLLALYGWRITYVIFGVMLLIVALPIQYYLARHQSVHRGHFLPDESHINPQTLTSLDITPHHAAERNTSFREVARDPNFYLVISASCIPPMIVTGLLFHQSTLFAYHHWPIALAVSGLGLYALLKAVASVVVGPTVDRHGPIPAFTIMILMLGFATMIAGAGGPDWIVYIYLGLVGTALGLGSPVINVIFPNMYGTRNLGAIKGYSATFRNGLTALGPMPIAIGLDLGLPIGGVLTVTGGIICLMAVLPWWVAKRNPLIHGEKSTL